MNNTHSFIDMKKLIDLMVKDDPNIRSEFSNQLEQEVARLLNVPQTTVHAETNEATSTEPEQTEE